MSTLTTETRRHGADLPDGVGCPRLSLPAGETQKRPSVFCLLSPASSRRGFTLYEVIIVMIIIGIMAAVVAPSFSTFFPAFKTQKAAEGLVATAGKAHADAVLTLRRYRLCLVAEPKDSSESPYYYLAFEADPLREPGTFKPLGGAWGQHEELPEDVTFETLDGAQDDTSTKEKYYEFSPDGTATEGSITVAHPKGDRVTVKIEGATGRVSIEETTEK